MKKFSQALVWLTVSEIIFNVAGYIIQSFLGRILGPEDYGRYGIIVTLTTMIIILIGNGIPTAMSKYLSEIMESAPERILGIKYQAIKLQIWLMLFVTVVFFFSAPLLSFFLHDSTLTPLFQISALIIPAFAAASFYFYYYTGLHFFRLQALLKTLRALARIAFIISFAYWFGVKGAVSGYIAAPLFVFLVAFVCDLVMTHRYFPTVKKSHADIITFSGKTLLNYAGPLTLFLLFYEFILTLDLYFVKSLLRSDYLTGIYNAVINAGRIPYYLFYALTIILLPAVSKTTAERNHAETEKLVNQSLRLMVFFLVPMVTLLVTYSQEVLRFFFGNKYDAGVAPLGIYAIGVGCLTVFYVLSFAINGAGLVKTPMKLSFLGFLAMVALNFLLIPKWRLIGAATATTLVSLVLMIAILIAIEKHFRVRLASKTILISVLSAFFLVLLTHILPHEGHIFILFGSILFVFHFVFLRLTGELTDQDIAPMLKLLRRWNLLGHLLF